MPALTFRQYSDQVFSTLSTDVKQRYQDTEGYFHYYATNNGFGDWLDTLRFQHLSIELLKDLATTFMTFGARSPNQIPGILSVLRRCFDAILPEDHAINTVEYWEKYAKEKD